MEVCRVLDRAEVFLVRAEVCRVEVCRVEVCLVEVCLRGINLSPYRVLDRVLDRVEVCLVEVCLRGINLSPYRVLDRVEVFLVRVVVLVRKCRTR